MVGTLTVVTATLVLWSTAPSWDGPFRPAPAAGSSPVFVLINVTEWGFTGSGQCWTSGFTAGGTVAAGGEFNASLLLRYASGAGNVTCTAQSVTVETAGFTLVASNAPLVVDSNNTAWLNVRTTVPTSSFTGPLQLNVNETEP